MPAQIVIDDLSRHTEWIPVIARAQFDLWGKLTGSETCDSYTCFLDGTAKEKGMPCTLVAVHGDTLVGSVNLVNSDMKTRPALTPWLAQLLVFPAFRRLGIGAMLVRAVSDRARMLGYRRLYLYTSGHLPRYYADLGWIPNECVEYLGKERTVMFYDLVPA